MGTSTSFGQVGDKFVKLGAAIKRIPKATGRAIGEFGRGEVLAVGVRQFGADLRFSGAARSRKAKRPASARYRVFDERVEIYPSGDPFYITMRGRRGGKRIYPLVSVEGRNGRVSRFAVNTRRGRAASGGRRRAIGGPGGPRAWARVGTLNDKPHLLDPAQAELRRRAPELVDKALIEELGKVF